MRVVQQILPVTTCAAALLFAPMGSSANTWHINPGGTGDAPTIQAAVNLAAAGDSIRLANGTYSGVGNREITIGDKAIFIASEGGDATLCIIDCATAGRGFLLDGNAALGLEDVSIVRAYSTGTGYTGGSAILSIGGAGTIRGCRFLNCSPKAVSDDQGGGWIFEDCLFEGNGGGASFHWSAKFSFVGCDFVGNAGTGLFARDAGDATVSAVSDCQFVSNAGGGLELSETSVKEVSNCVFRNNWGTALRLYAVYNQQFANCIFENNTGYEGGAVYANQSIPIFDGCTFSGNSAVSAGGAIFGYLAGHAELRNTLLVGNSAPKGGCLYGMTEYNFELTNCTLYNNASSSPGAIIQLLESTCTFANSIYAWSTGGAAISCDALSSVTSTCSNVFGNAGGDWIGCLSGQNGTNGNISTNPLFCNASHGDLHLSGISPCLNAPCGRMGALGQGCSWPTGVGDGAVPGYLVLHENVPNPFNRATVLPLDVPVGGARVSISVYDVSGRLVRNLARGFLTEGRSEIEWDGADESGKRVAAGVYFVRMQAAGSAQVRKVVLVK